MSDFQYKTISQYYYIYTPILWLIYFVIVYEILRRRRNSHFLCLVALIGIADLILCILGNFFYRWPRTGVFHTSVYQNLQNYSVLLSIFYFILFHLPYAEFFTVLFMSFNAFNGMVVPKYYKHFWNNCLYKYVIILTLLPIFLFSNVLLSQSRFRYVEATQQYYLFTVSSIPQYIARKIGNLILITLISLTVIFYMLTISIILLRMLQKSTNKPTRYHVENMLVGIAYMSLRLIFLIYEIKVNAYDETNDRISLYQAGNTFTFINDLITITPPLFLVLISSQIRQLLLTCVFIRKNRIDFDNRVDQLSSVGNDSSKEEIEDVAMIRPDIKETMQRDIGTADSIMTNRQPVIIANKERGTMAKVSREIPSVPLPYQHSAPNLGELAPDIQNISSHALIDDKSNSARQELCRVTTPSTGFEAKTREPIVNDNEDRPSSNSKLHLEASQEPAATLPHT